MLRKVSGDAQTVEKLVLTSPSPTALSKLRLIRTAGGERTSGVSRGPRLWGVTLLEE